MIRVLMITMTLLLSTWTCEAFEAKSLFKFCKGQVGATAKETAEATCSAYIRGLIDGMMMGSVSEAEHLFCIPKDGLSEDTARDIVVGYLAAHPEDGNQEAGGIAAIALLRAFACQPKSKSN